MPTASIRRACGDRSVGRSCADGIEKYFGTTTSCAACDLEVRQHETVMIIGRSGSGKTTLLRCLNFLEEPTVGTVDRRHHASRPIPLNARSRAHREQIRKLRLPAPAWCSRTSTCSRI